MTQLETAMKKHNILIFFVEKWEMANDNKRIFEVIDFFERIKKGTPGCLFSSCYKGPRLEDGVVIVGLTPLKTEAMMELVEAYNSDVKFEG